jgi:hypothetical protein
VARALPLFATAIAVLGISFSCHFSWHKPTSQLWEELAVIISLDKNPPSHVSDFNLLACASMMNSCRMSTTQSGLYGMHCTT